MATKRKRASTGSLQSEKHIDEPDELEVASIPWVITYPRVGTAKLTAIEQIQADLALKQTSPFKGRDQSESALDIYYYVEPYASWKNIKNYSNFVLKDETFSNNDFVWVNLAGVDYTGGFKIKDLGLARILEIKAQDNVHVYARVAWLYWPRDLPFCIDQKSKPTKGPRKYHASEHELIASNHMDIIDVNTITCKTNVVQWLEEDDIDPRTTEYWRQTFNIQTGVLSPLRTHCICETYYNPDHMMIFCPATTCQIWEHVDCILHDVLTKTFERLDDGASTSTISVKTKNYIRGKPDSKSRRLQNRKPYAGLFSAKIITQKEGSHCIEVTDLRENDITPKTWTEDIYCLKCLAKID